MTYNINWKITGAKRIVEVAQDSFVVEIADTAKLDRHDADGVSVNVRGSNVAADIDRQRIDSMELHDGDALLLWRAGPNQAGSYWASNWPEIGSASRSRNARCVSIVCVADYEQDGIYPIVGDPRIRMFGPPKMTRLEELPRAVTAPADVDALLEHSEKVFGGCCGEAWSGWSTDTRTPAFGHPGYGNDLARETSQAVLLLCCDIEPGRKRKLAYGVCQWGITLQSAMLDGRKPQANGGHCQGRTALALVAGWLCGMQYLSRFWSHPSQESLQFFESEGVSWWHDTEWKALWQRSDDHRWGNSPVPIDRPPSEWTATERGHRWAFQGYYAPSCAANVGTAVALWLLEMTAEVGSAFFDAIDNYMQGPSEAANQELVAAGVTVPWGKCPEFAAQAWREVQS